LKTSKFQKAIAHDLLATQPPKKPSSTRPLDMVWVTKDRKRITPQEMDDAHLLNCIRLLERQAAEMKLALRLTQTPAEIASQAFPVHDVMVDELERRLNKANEKAPVLEINKRRKFRFEDNEPKNQGKENDNEQK
jgi:hypothetical protein